MAILYFYRLVVHLYAIKKTNTAEYLWHRSGPYLACVTVPLANIWSAKITLVWLICVCQMLATKLAAALPRQPK